MGAPQRLHACFRKSEVPDFACLNQIFYGSGYLFNRHVRIDAMLVENIDAIGLQSFERGIGDLFYVSGTAVCAGLLSLRSKCETKLCGYHDLIAKRSDRFANKFFIREW